MLKKYSCFISILIIIVSGCSVKRKVVKQNNTTPIVQQHVIAFAKTLIGTPYKYGGTLPNTGFDCSGFVQYTFANFNRKVPRTSKEYANIGTEINLYKAKPEDIILFAGSNGDVKQIQHMGIVIDNTNGNLQFIHSSSSKGVMISTLDKYFKPRFIKVIRLPN